MSKYDMLAESQKVHYVLLLLLVAIIAAPFLFYFNNTQLCVFGFEWPLQCQLYRTFGIKCALCGLTRSFYALAHGRFISAFSFHPLGPMVFAFICLQILYRIHAAAIRPREVSRKLLKTNLILTAFVFMAIFVNWLIYLGGLIV